MTTLCFFSSTGGELTLVSQALPRLCADGLDVTLSGRCLLYTSPSPRDATLSRMPSSA